MYMKLIMKKFMIDFMTINSICTEKGIVFNSNDNPLFFIKMVIKDRSKSSF